MSDKMINLAKLLGSQADKLGYKIGGKLPAVIESFLDSLIKKGQLGENLEELIPGAHKVLSKGIEFLGNVFELPKDDIKKVVPGFLGDVLYEALNEAVDAMGRGAGDAPKAADKAPEDSKPADAPHALDPGQMKGFVVGGQLHKSNCTTASRPRGFKGEKSPEDITVLDAIKRRHALSYCGCWGTPSEVEALEAQVKASFAPATEPKATKAEAPTETPAPKPEKPKYSLFDHLKRFYEEDPYAYMRTVDNAFRKLIAEDHDLKVKFYTAFEQYDYATFLYVVKKPNEYWHAELDMLIGQPKRDKSILKRELAEFDRMFDSLCEHVDAFAKWLLTITMDSEGKTSKQRRDARKKQWKKRDEKRVLKTRVTGYVVSGLALVGVATYFIYNSPL
ncbi:MAG: hypothetical protein QY323_04635 [Patescibacteria group bacterium]|nr:MAG: hypothetical protein QY323_04635 [Patescibacteria group bacterium]